MTIEVKGKLLVSRICQNPWLPLSFILSLLQNIMNLPQNKYTSFVSNYFLAFIYTFTT